MGVGTGASAIIGGIGSLGGAAIEGNAASNAASIQAQAAEQAAQLQYQESQNALGFQEQEYNQSQQNIQPWLQSGTGALSALDYGLGISPQSPSAYGGYSPISVNGATPPGAASATNAYGFEMSPTGQPVAPQGGTVSPTNIGSPGGQFGGSTLTNPGIQGAPPQATSGAVAARGFSLGPNGQPVASNGASPISGVAMLPGTPGNGTLPNGGTIGFNPSGSTPTGTGAAPTSGAPSTSGYGSLLAAYPGGAFQSPTLQQAEQMPGYQFQLQQGNQLLQQSAAAQGNLLTGGTAEALQNYGQGLAQTDYNNAYNQALTNYTTNYNAYENQQANEFNRLASLAGVGQTAAGQLSNAGQSAANNVSSNLLSTGSNIGQQLNNAAAANASGVVGSANAYGGALSNAGSSLSNLALLSQLQGGGGGGSLYPTSDSEYY